MSQQAISAGVSLYQNRKKLTDFFSLSENLLPSLHRITPDFMIGRNTLNVHVNLEKNSNKLFLLRKLLTKEVPLHTN